MKDVTVALAVAVAWVTMALLLMNMNADTSDPSRNDCHLIHRALQPKCTAYGGGF